MKTQQFFYACLGALLILTIGGGAGYYYASGAIHARTMVLEQRIATQDVIEDQINQLVNLKRSYQKLLPLKPQIEAALPLDKKQTDIALQLQQLASNAGMQLPNVNFAGSSTLPAATSQTVPAGGVLALPVSFNLSGTYDQLQNFLRGLESLNRYTGVSSLAITHKDDKSKTLDFAVTMKVYIKP